MNFTFKTCANALCNLLKWCLDCGHFPEVMDIFVEVRGLLLKLKRHQRLNVILTDLLEKKTSFMETHSEFILKCHYFNGEVCKIMTRYHGGESPDEYLFVDKTESVRFFKRTV